MLGILCVGAPWRRGGGTGAQPGSSGAAEFTCTPSRRSLSKCRESGCGYDCAGRGGLGLCALGLVAQGRGCAGALT